MRGHLQLLPRGIEGFRVRVLLNVPHMFGNLSQRDNIEAFVVLIRVFLHIQLIPDAELASLLILHVPFLENANKIAKFQRNRLLCIGFPSGTATRSVFFAFSVANLLFLSLPGLLSWGP